jgi:hypothetical protein
VSAFRVPRWLRRSAALLAVLLLVEYVILPQIAGARNALHVLSDVRPVYLVLGVLLEAASLAAYGLLTRTVLRPEGRPSLWTLIRIDLTTFGVSHVVPGGVATAATLRYRLLTGSGVSPPDAVSAEAIQGVGSAVVLNVMLWIALLISLPAHGGNAVYATVTGLGTLLIAAVFAVVVLVTRNDAGTVRVVRAVARRVPKLSVDSVERLVRTFAERLRALGTDKPLLLRAALWAAANWILDAASLWVFLAAYGHHTDPIGLLVAFGLANVLAAVPITPGGLGIVEGVLVPTLVGFGSPRSIAVLGVVTWRLANFWLPIPISALTYVSLRAGPLRHHRLPRVCPWTPETAALESGASLLDAPEIRGSERGDHDRAERAET